jgi:hypothetical protein
MFLSNAMLVAFTVPPPLKIPAPVVSQNPFATVRLIRVKSTFEFT